MPNIQGQINDDFITTLDSSIIITEIGSGIINYRFTVTNNGLAAGTFDEDLIFYLPLEYEKKIIGMPVTVECVDLGMWVRANFNESSLLIFKALKISSFVG